MTPKHVVLAVIAGAVLVGLAAVLVFTVVRLSRGERTVSGYMKDAPRWVVAAVGFAAGLVVGVLFSHWWFPTVGE